MAIIILHHKNGPVDHELERMIKTLQNVHRLEPEIINVESRDGAEKAKVYGISTYPAVIVTMDMTGSVIEQWEGNLPKAVEVSYHDKK